MAFAEVVSLAGEKLVSQWPFFLTTVLGLVGAWLLQQTFFKLDPLSKIPVAGSEIRDDNKRQEYFLANARLMYGRAYEILKKSMGACRLPTSRGISKSFLKALIVPIAKHLCVPISEPSRSCRSKVSARVEEHIRRDSRLCLSHRRRMLLHLVFVQYPSSQLIVGRLCIQSGQMLPQGGQSSLTLL